MTHQQFIEKSTSPCSVESWQGDATMRSRAIFSCSTHGRFEQTLSGHLKSGCPRCSKERAKEKLRQRLEEKWASGDYDGLSSSIREKWKDDDYRRRVTEESAKVIRTDAARDAARARSKEKWEDPDYRKKMALRPKPPSAKLSEASRAKYAGDSGRLIKEKIGKASRKMWERDHDRIASAVGEAHRTERARTRKAEIARKKWEDPEYRERVTTAVAAATSSEEVKERTRKRHKEAVSKESYKLNLAAAKARIGPTSQLNLAVSGILSDLGVEHYLEHQLGPWNFDVFIPGRNLLIECQGEYWHSLPKAVGNDKAKRTYVSRYHPGLTLLELWEVEFSKEMRLFSFLKEKADLSPVLIDNLNSIRVGPVNHDDAHQFYSKYHYLGSRKRSGYHYGAFHGDLLVGCCSFSPFHRHEQVLKYPGAVELSRFCLSPVVEAKNLGSWFLSRCVKAIGRPVVTFADKSQGHDGALYKACNFKLSHEVPRDYYYIDSSGYRAHKKAVWNRARSMRKTESEYATSHNLEKVWDGGKLCFVYGL